MNIFVYYTLLAITIVVVNLIDISGFVDEMKRFVWKWLYKGKREYRPFTFKPFDCSYCMTHWTGLFYLLLSGNITIWSYMALLLLCFLTPIIADCQRLVLDILTKGISLIYKILKI